MYIVKLYKHTRSSNGEDWTKIPVGYLKQMPSKGQEVSKEDLTLDKGEARQWSTRPNAEKEATGLLIPLDDYGTPLLRWKVCFAPQETRSIEWQRRFVMT